MLPDITVVPNPFQDFILVQSRRINFRTVQIQLHEMYGRLIFDQTEVTIPSKIYFPDYSPGMYLVTIKEDDGKMYQFNVMKN
ncbi:MAG TPA: T9SS type A sorting domain-containing protein [Saprospiraceae bacterium]